MTQKLPRPPSDPEVLGMRSMLFVLCSLASFLAVDVVRAETAAEEVAGQPLPAPIAITPELVEAHHAYQQAQLRWQQYRFVELPRQRQLLDDNVLLGESEIRVLRRRLRDYRPFLRAGRFSPARTAAENDRLALQAVEQQVQQARNQRINLMRYSRQTSQLYQLEVLRTAARVQQLMNETQQPVE